MPAPPGRGTGRLAERGVALALILIVAALSVLPMGRLLLEGVAPGGRLDLGPALAVLSSGSTWRAAANSLLVSVGGMVVSVALGTIFAVLVALTDIRGKAALVFCFLMPLMIPPQVTALSWVQLFGPASPLLDALGMAPPPGTPHPMYSPGGIVLLLGIQHAPLVFLTLRAGLRAMPRELVEAARAGGAGAQRVLADIVLPLAGPALIAGAALAFVSAIGNFGIPALLGIPIGFSTLPTLVYQRLAGFGPSVISDVAVLSILTGLLAFGGFALQSWMTTRHDTRIAGLASRPLSWRLGGWRPAVELAAWTVIAMILVVPLLALVATSLVRAYGVTLTLESATLGNFVEVLVNQAGTVRAFRNSTLLALGAAVVLMVVAVPLAYFVAWRRSRPFRALEMAAELPYALPGVVLSIACILVFLRPLPLVGVSLYGTVWIILVAYCARFLTLALRPAIGGYLQLDRGLEEAAQMTGAGFLFRLRTILLPLIAPAAAAGGLLVFMTAFNEITVSALLWSSGAETLGVTIFNLDDGGFTVLAAAVAVITVVVIVVLMLLASLAARRLPAGVLPWTA